MQEATASKATQTGFNVLQLPSAPCTKKKKVIKKPASRRISLVKMGRPLQRHRELPNCPSHSPVLDSEEELTDAEPDVPDSQEEFIPKDAAPDAATNNTTSPATEDKHKCIWIMIWLPWDVRRDVKFIVDHHKSILGLKHRVASWLWDHKCSSIPASVRLCDIRLVDPLRQIAFVNDDSILSEVGIVEGARLRAHDDAESECHQYSTPPTPPMRD